MAAARDAEEKFAPPRKKKRREDFGLTPAEIEGLRFFFDGAEGFFGVRSSQGVLEDELARRCPSVEALEQRARENRTRARRRRLPRKGLLSDPFAAAYAAAGIPSPSFRNEEDELPLWALEALSGSEDMSHVSTNPDVDLALAGKASHTRGRLRLVGSGWTGVLYAAHGPRAAGWAKSEAREVTHPAEVFGHRLCEIAAALLASRASVGDLGRYAMLWSAAADPAKSAPLREESEALLGEAHEAYKATRCPHPCPGCWPA